MSVFSTLTSLLSGSLSAIGDLGKAAKSIKTLITTLNKITKLISRINTIIETLGGLVTSVMNTYNNVNVVQGGHNLNTRKSLATTKTNDFKKNLTLSGIDSNLISFFILSITVTQHSIIIFNHVLYSASFHLLIHCLKLCTIVIRFLHSQSRT